MIHPLPIATTGIPLPKEFTYPFHYTPHPLCVAAAQEVQAYLATRTDWHEELQQGKMFGVLVVQDAQGQTGYLAAFSGNLAGSNHHEYFVPPVYDLLNPTGYFKEEEARISEINQQISELQNSSSSMSFRTEQSEVKNLVYTNVGASEIFRSALNDKKKALNDKKEELDDKKEELDDNKTDFEKKDTLIQQLKEERKQRSIALQQWIFEQFVIQNAKGEETDLYTLFTEHAHRNPPAGSGECAAPKLLQYAYSHSLRPLCMAEFWLGASPVGEVRRDGCFYGSCKGKCEPILSFMLQGLEVDGFMCDNAAAPCDIRILYEDGWFIVADKPSGVLSVPGKVGGLSVQEWLACHFGRVDILVAHRLDMSTSGLLVAAKGVGAYKAMQALFARREVTKKYMALLDGVPLNVNGVISLPLSPDYLNRPSQKVDYASGKEAVTKYEVLSVEEYGGRRCALVALYPLTGRTHQLRVHCAHKDGLDTPIVGDGLYGKSDRRLMLHAVHLRFVHPFTGEVVELESDFQFLGVE